MRRSFALLLGLVPVLHGCVTQWLIGELIHPKPPYVPPVAEIVSAVRTGDGAHHLLLRCADGSVRHVAFPAAVVAAVDSETTGWPLLVERDARVLGPGTPLPEGSPVPLGRWSWESQLPAPDPELRGALGHEWGENARWLEVDDRSVRLSDVEGSVLLLGRLPAEVLVLVPRPSEPRARALRALACVALLPFTLAADVALGGLVVVGVVVLLPVLPFLFGPGLDGP